jgi:pilus assembly protein CpaC
MKRSVAIALLAVLIPAPAHAAATPLALAAGKSQLLTTGSALSRVAVGDPKVADVRVLGQKQVLVQALKPGTTSLYLWTKDGEVAYDLTVGMDTVTIQKQLQELTGNKSLRVGFNGNSFLLTGEPTSSGQREQAEKVVASYGAPVINLAAVSGSREQIAIDVDILELSRTGGLNLGITPGGGEVTDNSGGVRKWTFKPGEVNMGEAVTGNLSSFAQIDFLAAKIEVMQQRGEAKLLAHPTLVTTDGGTAKFLAGGEVPIPIQSGLGQTTIMWKEFGVRLEVQPSRLSDGRISMSVKPEVSSLDFANGLKQASFNVPAVKTRRAETQVVLAPDEVLMLGGLMDAEQTKSYTQLPGIGDLPILGELFKSRRFQDNQTELAILVRPKLIAPDAQENLPGKLPDTAKEQRDALPKVDATPAPKADEGK